MEYVRLGNSGLKISALCLGCMTYGDPARGPHEWTLPEAESRPLIQSALEAGINFFDTANIYSHGSSEEILGAALRDFTRRDEVVVATKVHGQMQDGPNGRGLSRKAIFAEIDASLARLRMEYVDLYQIHRFDHETPIEETLEALHDVVKAGKARYIGASSMYAWQFCKALYLSRANGWARFISMQNHYNLLYREEEREMVGLCAEEGIGMIPWSPLARGRLARAVDAAQTHRLSTDHFGKFLYQDQSEQDHRIIGEVGVIAGARGVSRASVALAWLMAKTGVSAPIIGVAKPQHLKDAVAALGIKLQPDEIARLEAPYHARAVAGFV